MRLALLLLCPALLAVTPAAAQIVGRNHYGPVARPSPFLGDSRGPRVPVGGDLRDVRGDIDAARAAGRIDAREARRLRREAALIARLERRYGRDGLSDAEYDELDTRAAALRGRVNRR